MLEKFYFWLAARLPRRLMYHIINQVVIDGRNTYGDRWLFTLHKLGNLRSEYGACGRLGYRTSSGGFKC